MSNKECSCSALKIEALTSPIQHGEGPHWDQKKNVLYFVDTFQATAYRLKLDPAGNKLEHQKLEGRDSIGIIVPIKNTIDEFVIAADRYLYRLTWRDYENEIVGLTQIKMVDEEKHKNQFNDGKADAKGRLWIGTLTREEDLSVSNNGGALYRFDGGKLVSKQIDNTSISNGIAWSSDNTRFYFVDTETRDVIEYEYDSQSGELGPSTYKRCS
ncbi:hypothetical protein WA026_005692 [Henosepilachna vigintioctopunctata]|uniref:SMP-30/Gluconolactonase/LRE-like region domain-containing protein n=1 Tax=Henosepilachna vigintioctopunctata TaxID=420089 RepID=A0AAW1TVS9_9CUCU